jgi:hypothetical protein
MKSEVIVELLESAAEQLNIKVSYEPLQVSGIQTGLRGGLCKVKGTYRVIIDKRATNEERVTTLATSLAGFDTTELELPQKVRDLLRMYEGSGPRARLDRASTRDCARLRGCFGSSSSLSRSSRARRRNRISSISI